MLSSYCPGWSKVGVLHYIIHDNTPDIVSTLWWQEHLQSVADTKKNKTKNLPMHMFALMTLNMCVAHTRAITMLRRCWHIMPAQVRLHRVHAHTYMQYQSIRQVRTRCQVPRFGDSYVLGETWHWCILWTAERSPMKPCTFRSYSRHILTSNEAWCSVPESFSTLQGGL